MPDPDPNRSEVWLAELDLKPPARGHEQAGRRPVLVLSVNEFNHGPAELVVVLPITSKEKGIPFHVQIIPPEAGVKQKSFIKCEDIRSIAKERLIKRWGVVSSKTLATVEDSLKILLGFS
jgi:mRNA interferase MazF